LPPCGSTPSCPCLLTFVLGARSSSARYLRFFACRSRPVVSACGLCQGFFALWGSACRPCLLPFALAARSLHARLPAVLCLRGPVCRPCFARRRPGSLAAASAPDASALALLSGGLEFLFVVWRGLAVGVLCLFWLVGSFFGLSLMVVGVVFLCLVRYGEHPVADLRQGVRFMCGGLHHYWGLCCFCFSALC
jgi:hypothetical protein